MRQTKRIRLLGILLTLLIGIALHSTANGQTPVSASGSPTTVAASDLETCEKRLDKVLDALEKAEKALGAAVNEIEARKRLDELKNQWIAVKDLIIQEQDKLIQFYQKGEKRKGFIARLKQILAIAEKVALIALGGAIGRGL